MTHERFPNPFAFDMAVAEAVFFMMQRGLKVDLERRREFREGYESRLEIAQNKLRQITGFDLNVNSPKQVKEYLYDDLKLPPRYYHGSPTTREVALRALLATCDEKVKSLKSEAAIEKWLRGSLTIRFVLKARGLRKRISSYIMPHVDSDGRMRTTLSVGGTETGRFTSSKTLWNTGCNMQTIPRELRSIFIADEGKELCELDLNRGESWVYAHLANDPVMMEIHQEGRDFHAETAAAISYAFAVEPLSVKEILERIEAGDDEAYKLRYLGKRVNHASAYRMGPITGAEVVNAEADDTGITISVAQFRLAQQLWREKYFMMKSWWNDIERQLRAERTLVTPFGRKRTFFERWGDGLFKEATAYVPQSTSVDYINLGLLDAFSLQKEGAFGLEVLHQNHDSLLIQYDTGRRDEAIPTVIECIEREITVNDHKLTIPVEGAYGPSWGELTVWDE